MFSFSSRFRVIVRGNRFLLPTGPLWRPEQWLVIMTDLRGRVSHSEGTDVVGCQDSSDPSLWQRQYLPSEDIPLRGPQNVLSEELPWSPSIITKSHYPRGGWSLLPSAEGVGEPAKLASERAQPESKTRDRERGVGGEYPRYLSPSSSTCRGGRWEVSWILSSFIGEMSLFL